MLSLMLAAAATAGPTAEAPPLNDAFVHAKSVVTKTALPGELVIVDATGALRSAAFGLADRQHAKPNKVGQRWLWASVTKQVTATLVLAEVDRGTLALDAPLGRYLPTFKGDRSITIRELLQHRSGLPNPSDGASEVALPTFYRETGPGISNAARAGGFCAGPAKGPRDGSWDYNNCDYLVLGAALEAVTGKPYAQLVTERIARPVGLLTLRPAPDGATRGGAAAVGYEGSRPAPVLNVATGGAAAGLTGSAQDLARFDRALMVGNLLIPAARQTAWTGDPKLGYQALGVWSFSAPLAGCAGPVRLIERRGDFGGTQVRNVIAPALGRAVILFTNDVAVEFGEVWQGKGLSFDLLSAALCSPAAYPARNNATPSSRSHR